MKRLLSLVIVFLMAVTVSLAEPVDLKSMTDDELKELRTQIDTELAARQTQRSLDSALLFEGDFSTYHVGLVALTMDSEYRTNNPCVILTVLFVNNGEKAATFGTNLTIRVLQDGEQLEGAITLNGNDISTDDYFTDVKDGASVTCSTARILKNTTSPIEIVFEDFYDFSSDPANVSCVLNLPE